MERIMNGEIDWDHDVERDAVEGPVVCVSREEVLQELNDVKTGKAPGPLEVSLELIAASGGVGIQVMTEISMRVIGGFVMPVEWALSKMIPIFKGKGNVRNCSCYRAVKLLEHDMKVVKRVLEKKLCRIVSVDEIQYDFIPVSGKTDAVFILRRMQEEFHARGKKLCFMNLEKDFNSVPMKVMEWVMREKLIP